MLPPEEKANIVWKDFMDVSTHLRGRLSKLMESKNRIGVVFMFKLSLVEKFFYIVPNVALIAITLDGRLYVIADVWLVFFILINAALVASSAIGYFASKKGRNRISFFLFSCLLSPILMGLIVAVIADSNLPHQSKS